MHMQVYKKDQLLAELDFDMLTKSVCNYKTYSDDFVWLPAGKSKDLSFAKFEDFLESRCPSRHYMGLKEKLRLLNVEVYDPLAIVQATHGRMMCDYIWVRFDDEPISYEDMKLRD